MPAMREHVAKDLAGNDLCSARILGCAVRLLDLGSFRIGCDRYAVHDDTHGLTTCSPATSGSTARRSPSTMSAQRTLASVDPPRSTRTASHAISRMAKLVSDYLGNTPAADRLRFWGIAPDVGSLAYVAHNTYLVEIHGSSTDLAPGWRISCSCTDSDRPAAVNVVQRGWSTSSLCTVPATAPHKQHLRSATTCRLELVLTGACASASECILSTCRVAGKHRNCGGGESQPATAWTSRPMCKYAPNARIGARSHRGRRHAGATVGGLVRFAGALV